MDNKKDIISYETNKKPFVKKGYSKETQGSDESRKELSSLKKGQQVSFSVFLFKKTEKLTTALYMVTSFLSDKEPLKWKLRERSVELLSDILNIRNSNVSEVENIFADYVFSVKEIISLLEVASASKLISEMNFSILKKEYNLLKSLMDSEEYSDNRVGRFVFTKDFFADSGVLENPSKKKEELVQGHSETDREVDVKRQTEAPFTKDTYLPMSKSKKVSLPQRDTTKKTVTSPRTFKDIKVKKTDRRDRILKMFKKNKELTIRDIAKEISECSEKTIQRELISLVSFGVLNKKGERRWSRYSLK